MNKRQQAAKILNDKYLNKDFGVLKVLEFSHQIEYRKFYKCKCNRCKGFTKIRSDHLLKLPKSCGNCVNSLQKEIADNKYKKDRKYRKIFNAYKSNAKTRNIEFNLTLNNIKTLNNLECHYCGDINSSGIDRVNNDKGYNIDNCVSCCKFCNIMKNDNTLEMMLAKVKSIYKKHLK